MGVDYYACHCCMEARYEEFIASCESCGKSLCVDCLENTADVTRDSDFTYPFHNEDGEILAQYCPDCTAEPVDTRLPVRFRKLHADAATPVYAKPGDSGFDLVATEDVIVRPGETAKVPTGLAFEIPQGYEIQVRPRSGVTTKTKLRVAFGTVDQQYRGEVAVMVDNTAQKTVDIGVYSHLRLIDGDIVHSEVKRQPNTYLIRKGDRIAQAVIAPVATATFTQVDELNETERGTGGFGSTGTR